VQKSLQPALVSGLLLLAAWLRLTGLAWGLNSGYGHDRNFQPDEFVSLRGVLQLNLPAGHIKAPGAYFEGTFNYYLWAVLKAVIKVAGKKDAHFSNSISAKEFADLLYACRWLSVLFDLCTIAIVFLAIREATHDFYSSLFGALCYAVIPIQVIYAHFMRTHILSNLLCGLVIWLSLKLRKSHSWQLLLSVGFISGLGAATRYPVGIIVVIPCLYLLFTAHDDSRDCKSGAWEHAKDFMAGPAWLIGLGFVIGLCLGHPMLFFNSSSVTKAITGETLKYASLQEFNASRFINLGVVWRYFTYVIPYAMYPLLWLVPYCAVLYLLFRRKLYSLSLPIMIFAGLYLYFMGKGYLGPYFARITMLLFPGFCVLAGIACSDLWSILRKKPAMAVVLAGALLLILGPSIAFDLAYSRAMQQKDAREIVREDLQKLIGKGPATIGVWRLGAYFYAVMPAAKPLSSQKITVRLQDPAQDADFLLAGFPIEFGPAQIKATVEEVEAQKKFKYAKSYHVPVKIFGHKFSLARFPLDMTYPFPTILLFRARAPTWG
jgi:hypothetical protein